MLTLEAQDACWYGMLSAGVAGAAATLLVVLVALLVRDWRRERQVRRQCAAWLARARGRA